jgi:hypothetical protein
MIQNQVLKIYFTINPRRAFPDVLGIGGQAEAKFETWLVEVVDEVFGNDPTKAQDDVVYGQSVSGLEHGVMIFKILITVTLNPFELDDFVNRNSTVSVG